jgi:hypothetical protein
LAKGVAGGRPNQPPHGDTMSDGDKISIQLSPLLAYRLLKLQAAPSGQDEVTFQLPREDAEDVFGQMAMQLGGEGINDTTNVTLDKGYFEGLIDGSGFGFEAIKKGIAQDMEPMDGPPVTVILPRDAAIGWYHGLSYGLKADY